MKFRASSVHYHPNLSPLPTGGSPGCHWNLFDRWSAETYYRDYYSERVEPDEQAAMRFQIEFLRQSGRRFERAIEYGCGPTLMRALSAAHHVGQLDMADWHAGNLERIRRWHGCAPDADDWSSFALYALSVEGRSG